MSKLQLQSFLLNSSKGNNSTVQLKIGLSGLISKLSFTKRLKLLVSEAKISRWSESIVQLHCSRWSETTGYFTLLTRLPVKFEIPIRSATLIKSVGKFYNNKWHCRYYTNNDKHG